MWTLSQCNSNSILKIHLSLVSGVEINPPVYQTPLDEVAQVLDDSSAQLKATVMAVVASAIDTRMYDHKYLCLIVKER